MRSLENTQPYLRSTGAGKSCTIASLIQSILEQPAIKRTTFVILDTNGEYRSGFQNKNEDNRWEDIAESSCLYIPSDSGIVEDCLAIPYWFMNADDFVRLFQASKGVQRPVLLEALRLARNESGIASPLAILSGELVHEFNRIWSLSGRDEKTSKDVRDLAVGLKDRIEQEDVSNAWVHAQDLYGFGQAEVNAALDTIQTEAENHIEQDTYPKVLPANARKTIRDAIEPLYHKVTGVELGQADHTTDRSADAPSYFDKLKFRSQHIEQVLRREESGGARARDFSGTMLLRIDRLLADRRFDFLFGPSRTALRHPNHVLAAFLRDVIGIGASPNSPLLLSCEADVPKKQLPFYDRQRAEAQAVNIVILDLSLLAAEVLENITALIGRLILEFLQRLGDHGGEEARGSLPVVLVLEEAQNYIQQPHFADEESISRLVFERIAREGRKHGLGLIVASQRPSELSKTVLSQCNSFIVHRLQNPEDLRYFKEIVPGIYGPMLDQLPALAQQTALVLGECVPAPSLVKIREAHPVPRSRDPKFFRYWTSGDPPNVPVEEITKEWEGNSDNCEKDGEPSNDSERVDVGCDDDLPF